MLATGVVAALLLIQAGAPTRVLLTNDNGIDDPKLVALAREFARRSETWVVAPAGNRSGTGNFLSVSQTGSLTVERRNLGPNIVAWAVDGYPADCVVLALLALMKDRRPDVVVSGINGGANLGSDWMFSGTIGAARVAALAGVPALAVSGLDDDIPGAVSAAVRWVVELAGQPMVRSMAPLQYLTVSLPRVPPDSIQGVRLADRAGLRSVPRFAEDSPGRWKIVGVDQTVVAPAPDSDLSGWDAGYITIVPMRADEVDLAWLADLRRRHRTPVWR